MNQIEIGRLLRASTTEFLVGCRVSQLEAPVFGALVRVPLGHDYQVYGLIYDMRIEDDGLVRQLATAVHVDETVIADNQLNRTVPVEIGVLATGYQRAGSIFHMLPPRPPLSLDTIYLCQPDEIRQFTSAGRFGYFRHVLRAIDLPVGELLASHLQQAQMAHAAAGNPGWIEAATQELIVLLRDDYALLMSVLGALGDVVGGHA